MRYVRALAFAVLAGATIVTTGCAVVRNQESVGAYVDDAAITTAIKAKFVEDKNVDAGAIKVETLNGAVSLSGFAKSNAEKAQAAPSAQPYSRAALKRLARMGSAAMGTLSGNHFPGG